MYRRIAITFAALIFAFLAALSVSAQTQPQFIRDSQTFQGKNINEWALVLLAGTVTARACSSDSYLILRNNFTSIMNAAKRKGTLTRQGRGTLEHLDGMIDHGVNLHKQQNKSCSNIEKFNRWIIQNTLEIVDSYK